MFIGDNFTTGTFCNYFKRSPVQFFIKDHYEFPAFCSSRGSSSMANMLARLQNSFAAGLNQTKEEAMLPRYIIIVLDDDLITFLDYSKEGATTLLGTWLEWLAKQFKDLLDQRIAQLPAKCKKSSLLPFFYWVAAPTHSYMSKERNNLHIKFNLALDSVLKLYDSMRIIRLKEHWDTKDSNLVVNDRFTDAAVTLLTCS